MLYSQFRFSIYSMAVKEKFVLSWNDYSKNVCSALQDIRQQSEVFDITLAVENKQIHAHKLVLAASSTFFRSVIKNNPHQHPLFYLKVGHAFFSTISTKIFIFHLSVTGSQIV